MARSAAKARERGFCKIHPRERKNSFAKEWRKVLAKDHVIRTKSHEVFNTAQVVIVMVSLLQKLVQDRFFRATSREKIFPALCPQYIQHQIHRPFHDTPWPRPFQDDDFRLKMGGLVVVASNAGGAWTPIGDITTTMLYIGGQVPLVMWC